MRWPELNLDALTVVKMHFTASSSVAAMTSWVLDNLNDYEYSIIQHRGIITFQHRNDALAFIVKFGGTVQDE